LYYIHALCVYPANYSCIYQPMLLRMPHLLQHTACLWDLQIAQAISRSFFVEAADFVLFWSAKNSLQPTFCMFEKSYCAC